MLVGGRTKTAAKGCSPIHSEPVPGSVKNNLCDPICRFILFFWFSFQPFLRGGPLAVFTTTTTPPPPPSFRVLLHSMHGRDIRRFPSSRIMLMAAKYYWPAVRRLETSHPSTALLQHSRAHTFAHVRCSVTAAASFHHQQQPHAGHWCSWLLGV